jgi:hypothetical protein
MPLCPTVAGGMHRLPELNTLLRALTLVAEAMVLQGSLPLRARNARLPMGLTDLALKVPREWLSKSLVLSVEMTIRPATLPKLDNGVKFQLVSMVNRYGISAAERGRTVCFSFRCV